MELGKVIAFFLILFSGLWLFFFGVIYLADWGVRKANEAYQRQQERKNRQAIEAVEPAHD